ncbi:MaoC family dehydratase [Labrys monachus]|uniref:Acyl dehydratase n=1 Tax=Labrys monachus TaxID=217067 RepID=A0ABU0F955_9HYPH|nr:MaoC/PaaZ C-terminal domain-containing protein [Labrys monachus]MDQ0390976.1 acyl dehydratase [Labrys monachus]
MSSSPATFPPGRQLAGGRYHYEDIEVGDWYATPPATITESHIDRFAALSGDFFAVHMDEAAARDLGFPGRIAHGLLVLAIVDGLKNQSEALFHAVASLGWRWSFDAPVFIADRLFARISVLGKRETRHPGRAIVELGFHVVNQHGRVVQSGTNTLMILRDRRESADPTDGGAGDGSDAGLPNS